MRRFLYALLTISVTLDTSCNSSKKNEIEANQDESVISDTWIAKSGKENYERIKKEYDLFGKWIIKNTDANVSYRYEIYNSRMKYVGVSIREDWDYITEILIRSNDKFRVKDANLYYQINSKLEMEFFESDGKPFANGYVAIWTTSDSVMKAPEIDMTEFDENIDASEVKSYSEADKIKALKEFKELYDELIEFKRTNDFKKYGFAEGGPYNGWLKRVDNLANKYDSKIFADQGILMGNLQVLGVYYVSSEGEETSETDFYNKIFRTALKNNRLL